MAFTASAVFAAFAAFAVFAVFAVFAAFAVFVVFAVFAAFAGGVYLSVTAGAGQITGGCQWLPMLIGNVRPVAIGVKLLGPAGMNKKYARNAGRHRQKIAHLLCRTDKESFKSMPAA